MYERDRLLEFTTASVITYILYISVSRMSKVRRKPRKRPRHSPKTSTEPSTPSAGTGIIDIGEVTEAFSGMVVTPKSRRQGTRYLLLRKRLDFDQTESSIVHRKMPTWRMSEIKSLVEYLMLHTDGTHWVSHNDPNFWDGAGKFIQSQIQSLHCRTGIIY